MRNGLANLKALWAARSGMERTTLIVAAVLALIAFLPTLQFDYVPQDQWRAFRCQGNELRILPAFYFRTGRPLVWLGEYAEHQFVATIADFRWLRPFCLACYVGAGFALALALWRACGILPVAVAASLLFLFVPGVSFVYYQGLTGAPVTLCITLAAIAFLLVTGPPGSSAPRIFSFGRRDLGACLVFLSALCIYPAWTMTVLPLLLLGFAFGEHASTRDRLAQLVRSSALFLGTALFYFVLVKLCIAVNLLGAGAKKVESDYDFAMNLSLPHLGQKFLMVVRMAGGAPVLAILNLGAGAGAALLAYFAAATAVRFANESNGSRSTWFARLVLGCAGAMLASALYLAGSVAPWLVSGMNGIASRYVIPVNLVLLTLAMLAVWKIGACIHETVSRAALLLVCVLAAVAQNQLATCEVIASSLEIAEMRKGVNQWLELGGADTYRNIVVIVPSADRPPCTVNLSFPPEAFGENGVFASRCHPEHIRQMLLAVLSETCGRDRALPRLEDCLLDRKLARQEIALGKTVVQVSKTGDYVESENTLIINLSPLGTHFIAPRPIGSVSGKTDLGSLEDRGGAAHD